MVAYRCPAGLAHEEEPLQVCKNIRTLTDEASDLLQQGEIARSVDKLQEAMKIATSANVAEELAIVETLILLADGHERLGKHELAESEYTHALKISSEFDLALRPYLRGTAAVDLDALPSGLRQQITHLGGVTPAICALADSYVRQLMHTIQAREFKHTRILRDSLLNTVLSLGTEVEPGRRAFYYFVLGQLVADFNPTNSRLLLRKSIGLARMTQDEQVLSNALSCDAEVALRCSDYSLGLQEALEAEGLHRKLKDLKAMLADEELLARYYEVLGDFEKAIFRSAAQETIAEHLNDTTSRAKALLNMASVELKSNLINGAEARLEKAMLFQKSHPHEFSPCASAAFELLGQLAEAKKEPAQALKFYTESANAGDINNGEVEPRLSAQIKLANLAIRQNDGLSAARSAHDLSFHLRNKMERELPFMLLSERLAFISDQFPDAVSAIVSCARHVPGASDGLYALFARFKGAIINTVAEDRQMLSQASHTKTGVEIWNDLQHIQQQLQSQLSETDDWSQLLSEKETIERILMSEPLISKQHQLEQTSSIASKFPRFNVHDLLDDKECLVDLYAYIDAVSGKKLYGAFVSRHTGETEFVNLDGNLETAVRTWYDSVSRPPGSSQPRNVSSVMPSEPSIRQEPELRRALLKYLAPVQARTKSFKRIYIASDEVLTLIPWAEFIGSAGTSVVTLGNPTELESRKPWAAMKDSLQEMLCIANVDYSPTGLNPLPFTADEIPVCKTFSKSNCTEFTDLQGRKATKSAICQAATSASVFHIATHGYFNNIAAPKTRSLLERASYLRARNPLLQEGLVVATDQDAESSTDHKPAHLTAQEIATLDMSKCKLVVLSACDTGRGQIIPFEGTLGLRTAFAAAGAKNVLVSLWPVNDHSTAALMRLFYEALGDGKDPALALRTAQQTLRKDPKWKAPYYWMGWMVVGCS